jgi:alkanesulfonate monooxygenase SsuD/methylene tetrahydromethanopterin reductase-like flavin-dependent oxidoreductase (luciferase family)
MAGLPVLPPTYQQPHPPIWVACLLSPESFEWTAQGYHLLYVAYHVDYPLAVERIGWYRTALRNHGRRIEGSRGLLRLPAHFIASDDDDALQRIVHKPMTEYAAPGLEAARKRPYLTAYKGYEQRDAGQRKFEFESYFPGRVLMGGPQQAIERIRILRDVGTPRSGCWSTSAHCAGADHALAGDIRGRHPAARARSVTRAAANLTTM